MCGIAGWVRLDKGYNVCVGFADYMQNVLERVSRRGPDAFGYITLSPAIGANDSIINKMTIDRNNPNILAQINATQLAETTSSIAALYNFRGIPTTEYFQDRSNSNENIQPFIDEDEGFAVIHNGLFNNDKELSEKYSLPNMTMSEHDIDSYIILKLLKHYTTKNDSSFDNAHLFEKVIHEVQGSFALAVMSMKDNYLSWARSYRGLYFTIYTDPVDNAKFLVWASENWHLTDNRVGRIFEFPINSYVTVPLTSLLNTSNPIEFLANLTQPIRSNKPSNSNKIAVVLSGGLDSTVCATMCAEDFKEVHLLHYHYGARAEEKEKEAVDRIHKYLCNKFPNTKFYLEFIELSFLKELGGSSLTDYSKDVAQGEKGVEVAHEWVPARNLVMISLAGAYCDRFDIGHICLGLNMEEGSVYPDNSIEFYTELNKALQYGTQSQTKLYMPLGNLMKHHILELGFQIEAPLHLSWSCYHGNEIRCGDCGPDFMRMKAHLMINKKETVKYASYPEWFPKHLRCE